MKVIIIGANGQVGVDLVKEFVSAGHEVTSMTHEDIEVSDTESVKEALDREFDVVVNTSCSHTMTCEKDPGRAYLINGIGPRNLAALALEHKALLVHVSTDQVFDGQKDAAYIETDVPNPVTVYGNTKLAGEYFALNSGANVQILRTTALFGHAATRGKPGGLNFVEMMLKLAREKGVVSVVNEEFTTPTSTVSFAKQAVVLSTTKHYGIFHAFGLGSCSWYEFAKEIFQQTDTKVELKISAPNFSGITRPKYVTMSNFRLRDLDLNVFKPWREELRGYLACRNHV